VGGHLRVSLAVCARARRQRHDDCHGPRRSLATLPQDQFDIDHVTLQVDHDIPELISIEMPQQPRTTPATS
jgi:hypothetical protein